ncbi:cysteine--tRNA ligase [Bombilactobacillus thymidiniphilus]|uniref:Cysteine--tRNA ligase n=1 Tax=Bombilactobacillus thymidiniphilus TaxID=2923363 RepID=A0ABY4PE64_9LACO|nr:cysteine--tRNA ligase [Bombilactobacillus thymidiniphilus]UQS83948.1 cysteine--tRNA ligase [Bombilactobacillus thymidiniphilus]
MLKIFNTLTKTKEQFIPQVDKKVSMYVCGPTVYNYIHIGNARSISAFDTVRRYLEYRGYQVQYVSNFTDIDDKIIAAAKQQQLKPLVLAQQYITAYQQDVAQLNIEPATANPRATENMTAIIEFITDLIAKDMAYESAGDVYYRARKFANYGQLSGQNIDDLEHGASQHINAQETARKQDPIDFALWKKAKTGEIAWNSPWGAGRPGWHIECSVMATKYLGATIDIHAGGEDLVFPHHENEIAQSEVQTGQKFVNYWMHNGFVTIGADNEKMSKSLGNFVTVHELLQEVDHQVLRFFLSSTQYRRPLQYSMANLQTAQDNLKRLQTAWKNLLFRQDEIEQASFDPIVEQELQNIEQQFIQHMDDDFNVQNALSDLFEIVHLLNNYSNRKNVNQQNIQQLATKFSQLVQIFGVELTAVSNLDAQIEELIKKRDRARAAKNFTLSDQLRDQLQAMDIILEDTPQGTRWHKK